MRRHKHRNRRKSKQSKIIIITSVCLLFVITAGYAVFSTNINITAKGNIIDNSVDITDNIVTNGDGLYEDAYEAGRYIYRGTDPDNYIEFNNELWRIIAKENDGTYKIIRNDVLENKEYDVLNRNQGSSGYCNDTSYGCNIWGSNSTLYDSAGSKITSLPRTIDGISYPLPDEETSLNIYLNTTYYNNILNVESQNKIVNGWFDVSRVSDNIDYNLNESFVQSTLARWSGKIGLINIIEYVQAGTNVICDSIYDFYQNSECYSDSQNYLNTENYFWTLSPSTGAYPGTGSVWIVGSDGRIYSFHYPVSSQYGVRPVVYLKSDITLSGNGTEEEPYVIN